MRLAFFQFCPVRGDPRTNIARIRQALDGLEADLVVLPELATTGYMFPSRDHAAELAEDREGPTVEALADACGRGSFHAVCGMAEKDGDRLYNSAVVVGPDGLVATYRKTHLFGDEKRIFDAGDTGFAVHQVAGARVGVLVCFDWIFPESARVLALAGADVVAHPSNLVLPWAQQATVTRCIENRFYWVLANRTGCETRGDDTLNFTGASRITGPGGKVLLDASTTDDCVGVVDVDLSAARDKRVNPENHLFEDRRVDLYTGLTANPEAR